mmetsp:Transcript_18020/g.45807  ORF Transcript_18020/g.45807 Transcript_18020/m.45807 type:complete len:234 (+) Transcript_18020:288-989(+)
MGKVGSLPARELRVRRALLPRKVKVVHRHTAPIAQLSPLSRATVALLHQLCKVAVRGGLDAPRSPHVHGKHAADIVWPFVAAVKRRDHVLLHFVLAHSALRGVVQLPHLAPDAVSVHGEWIVRRGDHDIQEQTVLLVGFFEKVAILLLAELAEALCVLLGRLLDLALDPSVHFLVPLVVASKLLALLHLVMKVQHVVDLAQVLVSVLNALREVLEALLLFGSNVLQFLAHLAL